MTVGCKPAGAAVLMLLFSTLVAGQTAPGASGLPAFGRDTVLVWKIVNQELDPSEFVVRIAEFLPDRFVEWENTSTQGTIFMPNRAILGARTFVNASLFEAGVDARGKDKTTLWLSRQIFRDLKEKKRIKISLDAIDSWITLKGSEEISVVVNRVPMNLPVILVTDDRGSERAFLDSEDNPLLVRHTIRKYLEILSGITTDKTNTLRWIKGKKLTNPH